VYTEHFAAFVWFTPSFPSFSPVFTVWHACCFVYDSDEQYTKTVSSPERTKTMMNKMITMAAAALMLAAGNMQAQSSNVPAGITAIVNSGSGIKFYGESGSKDGKTIFWTFIVSLPNDAAVMVSVPSYCTPDHFSAHVTVALDAVKYFISGEIPKGYSLDADMPAIDQILAVNGNHFLGVFPNIDHTESRWLFYVEAYRDNPAVVVNVAPSITTEGEFSTAYWTAVDAVKWYMWATKPAQKAKPTKVQFTSAQSLIDALNGESVQFSTRKHPLV
jgi:hypothetical protein